MRVNFNKVTCINLKSVNQQQLLAICETYLFGFEGLLIDKKEGMNLIWLDSEARTVAYTYTGDWGEVLVKGSHYNGMIKKDYDRIMDIKPVKTPKFPKTDQALNNYIAFLKEGFDVRIPAIDSLIEHKIREQERYKEIQQIPVILDMDIILDKINKYGITSLTDEEKDYMDNI